MNERKKQLTNSARLLQVRLRDLECKSQKGVSDVRRPMHQVAVKAVRDELTNVGRQLKRMG